MPRYSRTREQEAERLGISTRYVDMLRAVQRLRPDLAERINGFYTINMAYQEAVSGVASPTWTALCRAWNDASKDDRQALLDELEEDEPEEAGE
jgi:hypothetical protein